MSARRPGSGRRWIAGILAVGIASAWVAVQALDTPWVIAGTCVAVLWAAAAGAAHRRQRVAFHAALASIMLILATALGLTLSLHEWGAAPLLVVLALMLVLAALAPLVYAFTFPPSLLRAKTDPGDQRKGDPE